MNNWIRYNILIGLMYLSGYASGQDWVMPETEMIFQAGPGKYQIELKLKIREGIHINSDQPDNHLLIPTRFEAVWPENIKAESIEFSKTVPLKLEGFSESLEVFQSAFSLTIQFENNTKYDSVRIPCKLTYQACDERKCYFPRVMEFDITLISD
jgi:hypothetical protein